MTAPILFNTLVQLSQRLPERFTHDVEALYGEGDVILHAPDNSLSYADCCMYVGGRSLFLMWLELALRYEIQERGWNWGGGQDAGNRPYASVMTMHTHRPPVWADTPAHALALALLKVLEAE